MLSVRELLLFSLLSCSAVYGRKRLSCDRGSVIIGCCPSSTPEESQGGSLPKGLLTKCPLQCSPKTGASASTMSRSRGCVGSCHTVPAWLQVSQLCLMEEKGKHCAKFSYR